MFLSIEIPLLHNLIYCAAGAVGGLFMGLVGIGIGTIVVPTLAVILPYMNIPPEITMQVAIATSLTIIMLATFISTFVHHNNQTIDWLLLYQLLPGSLLGGVVGVCLVIVLPSSYLKILFAFLLLSAGIKMLWKKKPSSTTAILDRKRLFFVSILMGVGSNLLGISISAFMIPYLVHCNIRMINAIATATALIIPVGIIGTVPLIMVGLHDQNLPSDCIGYVYLPALFFIGIASVLFSLIGIKIGKNMPEKYLKNLFGFGMLVMSVKMLMS